MKRLLCLLLSPLLLLLSCGDAENEYTIGACYLAIDNSQHNDAILASAMNVNSPGIFCLIKSEVQAGGATYFAFTNNAGQSSRSINESIRNCRLNAGESTHYCALVEASLDLSTNAATISATEAIAPVAVEHK